MPDVHEMLDLSRKVKGHIESSFRNEFLSLNFSVVITNIDFFDNFVFNK